MHEKVFLNSIQGPISITSWHIWRPLTTKREHPSPPRVRCCFTHPQINNFVPTYERIWICFALSSIASKTSGFLRKRLIIKGKPLVDLNMQALQGCSLALFVEITQKRPFIKSKQMQVYKLLCYANLCFWKIWKHSNIFQSIYIQGLLPKKYCAVFHQILEILLGNISRNFSGLINKVMNLLQTPKTTFCCTGHSPTGNF